MSGEIHVWMPMIGFERNDPDRGASRVLKQMGRPPKGISAFLFHPDIVHQHEGMAVERMLPPDNCSYYASPRNDERQRQEWSNFDLKILLQHLREAGVEVYLGIMGVHFNDKWHPEWLTQHQELRCAYRE